MITVLLRQSARSLNGLAHAPAGFRGSSHEALAATEAAAVLAEYAVDLAYRIAQHLTPGQARP